MLRHDDEAFRRGEPGREPEHQGGGSPEEPLALTAEGAADQDEHCRGEVERHQSQNRSYLGERGTAEVHTGMQDDDGEVPNPEGKALTLIGVGNGQSNEEECAHAAEQEQLMPEVVGGDRIRQPCVAVVHPPDHRQHHNDLRDCGRVSTLHQHWSAGWS